MLKAVENIVCKDRDAQYGHPENNFKLIADLWSIWLSSQVTAHDVAMMMALLKIARIKTGKPKEDNYIDLAGYTACGCEITTPNGNVDESDSSIKEKPRFRFEDYPKGGIF